MLFRPDGIIIHACTFLADNIVYTKNGANATVPWTLRSRGESFFYMECTGRAKAATALWLFLYIWSAMA